MTKNIPGIKIPEPPPKPTCATTSPQKTERPLETQVSQGPLIDLDHAISTAIQIALRRGVSVDSITAMLTEINIEFKNARPYIQAALKPHQNTEAGPG